LGQLAPRHSSTPLLDIPSPRALLPLRRPFSGSALSTRPPSEPASIGRCVSPVPAPSDPSSSGGCSTPPSSSACSLRPLVQWRLLEAASCRSYLPPSSSSPPSSGGASLEALVQWRLLEADSCRPYLPPSSSTPPSSGGASLQRHFLLSWTLQGSILESRG